MSILLTGASGFIGSHIDAALRASGYTVTGMSRRTGCDYRELTDTTAWLPHLDGIDAVINSVGIISEMEPGDFEYLHHHAPAALFRACELAGIRRVIQISALGADASATTPYHRSKLAADEVLRGCSLDWFILRPSLVYGAGSRSMALFERLASLPVIPLVSGGRQMLQPVHIDDLVELVLNCLSSARSRITLDVVGAKPVCLKDWLSLIRCAAGKREARVLPVPYVLGLAASYISRYFSPLVQPDNLRMLQAGNTADPSPVAVMLGHMPVDIETGWKRR